jgi:hypothetical protein
MESLSVTASVNSILTWDYRSTDPRLRSLYERAKTGQWNADTDLDWSTEVCFGSPLPDGSPFARTSFEASPLGARGRSHWDTYRWEVQSWMVSQFLHGEQGALVVAARLVEAVPGIDAKYYAASQVADEARHVEVFSRYLREKIPAAYPINSALRQLLEDILRDSRWDVTALGMQIMVEALAMAAFRLANSTFHDELIRDITRLVARDEARHVSFGVLSLENLYRELTDAERADREDLVLESASLMRRRFLLEDVWDRMDVDAEEGMAYARSDELMITYRQTIFTKVVSALGRIGLMTDRVMAGLDALGLLAFASRPRPRTIRPR